MFIRWNVQSEWKDVSHLRRCFSPPLFVILQCKHTHKYANNWAHSVSLTQTTTSILDRTFFDIMSPPTPTITIITTCLNPWLYVSLSNSILNPETKSSPSDILFKKCGCLHLPKMSQGFKVAFAKTEVQQHAQKSPFGPILQELTISCKTQE